MNSDTRRTEAEALAVKALGYLAADHELMPRFLSLTGIEPSDIRQAARSPGFFAGILQFFLSHEPTLMRFCGDTQTDPAMVREAFRILPGGDAPHE